MFIAMKIETYSSVECLFILSLIINFRAPFTIQRLCELITEPKKHYKRADKFLRGIEKVNSHHIKDYWLNLIALCEIHIYQIFL